MDVPIPRPIKLAIKAVNRKTPIVLKPNRFNLLGSEKLKIDETIEKNKSGITTIFIALIYAVPIGLIANAASLNIKPKAIAATNAMRICLDNDSAVKREIIVATLPLKE